MKNLPTKINGKILEIRPKIKMNHDFYHYMTIQSLVYDEIQDKMINSQYLTLIIKNDDFFNLKIGKRYNFLIFIKPYAYSTTSEIQGSYMLLVKKFEILNTKKHL